MNNGRQRYFALHAHFYQPPRENPWTGQVPPQPSAWPFHDWNSRIARECYIPNAFARVNGHDGRPAEFVSNYEYLNFNFGPTLLSWLEKAHPFYYSKIIEAGRESRRRRGHSSAIAQGYNHLIMPLASFQDQLTQALWGLKDFESRFGFPAESIWLPETAASDATLRLLVDLGLKYVILSPYQAEAVRAPGEDGWQDVSMGTLDPTRPYLWTDPDAPGSGRSIALFFYDGPLSKAVAFENLLSDSSSFADRIEACYKRDEAGPQLVSMAVDGETFGHHHKFSELTLAHAFGHELPRRGIAVVNFAEYLAANPPQWEVRLKGGPDGEGTAWSCAHGVRRWKGGCTCGGEGDAPLNWRLPLRAALNSLRDAAAGVYASEGGKLFRDPWGARNAWGALLHGASAAEEDAFFAREAVRELTGAERSRALALLEMQRNAMYMFTSCGWFFSDVSRIETAQNLRYAARVAETLAEFGFESADRPFLAMLEMALSSHTATGNARRLYTRLVAENRLARQKAAALLIAEALLAEAPARGGAVRVEERMNRDGTLCLRGTVHAPGAGEYAFSCLRRGEEFPHMYFGRPEAARRHAELFAEKDPAALSAALAAEPGTDLVAFEDFSWEEKTLYAWLLSDSAKNAHFGAVTKILDDYLYLLLRLPERMLSAWTPLRVQASAFAQQAADAVFRKAAADPSPANIRALARLASQLKEAGLEAGFDPVPETADALTGALMRPALEKPSPGTLEALSELLGAAGDLGAGHMLFHLENGLAELHRLAAAGSLPQDCLPVMNKLLGQAGLPLGELAVPPPVSG